MQGFEQRYEEVEHRLKRHAMQITREAAQADDLLQMTAIRGWMRYESYDSSKSFLNWMMTIMRNIYLDDLRARSRRLQTVSLEGPLREEGGLIENDFADPAEPLEDLIARETFWSQLWAALATVPEVYCEALTMVYVRNMSYEECARASGIPMGTIRSRLSRGRAYLRQAMQGI